MQGSVKETSEMDTGRTLAIARGAISLLLLALLLLALAKLVWLVISPDTSIKVNQSSVDVPQQAATNDTDTADPNQFDIYLLSEINPFAGADGETAEDLDVPEQERIGNVKESSLNIEYLGGRATVEGTSVAFIKVPNSEQNLFYTGDPLINGYTLYQIEPLRLIIEREGELESVLLYGESVITGIEPDFESDLDAPVRDTRQPTTDPASSPRNNGGGLPIPPKPAQTESAEPIDGGSFSVEVQDLMTNATFARARSRGLSVGIILTPTKDRSILERVGLERTDVITAINGVNFQNINDAELLEQITKGGVLRLSVDRAGFDVPVNVSLQIKKEA